MKKRQRPEPTRAILVLCAAQFVDVLGVTELISALPRALAQLSASPAAAGPAVTAYAMCFGGLLMLGARLGARFGHQRMLRIGLATFAAGSILAALAPAVAVLIAARCLQGVAAAFSVPAALSLLLHITPDPRARDRAMAAWSAAGGGGGAGSAARSPSWRAGAHCSGSTFRSPPPS
jgi:MFS family permease